MTHTQDLRFRLAHAADAEAIAGLHADSWRRHYRGAYSDSFLDGDVLADRIAVWTGRLGKRDNRSHTILAEDATSVVAFAHTIFDDHATWGALLDNLHVAHRYQRRGVGSRLLKSAAEAVIEREAEPSLYLWVQEQNVDAQGFYLAHGARFVERAMVLPPGGITSRLSGSPTKLRYAWGDPRHLLESRSG